MGERNPQNVDFFSELKRMAESIKVAAEAITAAEHALDSFARSVIVEVNNTTSRHLHLHESGHDHGEFRDLPPDVILPASSRLFTSGSSGIATGTTGFVDFRLDGEGTIFHVEWVHPFVGGIETHTHVRGTHDDWYVWSALAGGGNAAHLRFMVGEKAAAAPRQSDWQTCWKCKTMFFVPQGADSDCAAGGRHEGAGFIFQLPHNIPGPDRQGEWRTCGKCKSLFWNGDPERKGACPEPSPASHAAAGLEFHLPVNAPEDGHPHQEGWRYCANCHGIFYQPHNVIGYVAHGHCSAGGVHVSQHENFRYFLPFDRPEDATHQSGWQTCGKCKLLFFTGHQADSECPAGGKHEGAGIVFQLPHSNPGDGREGEWRTCGKCKSLFWDGDGENKGLCAEPGPGRHVAAGLDFHLPHDMPGPGQADWIFCANCFCLIYQPQNTDAACPVGGRHNPMGFNFRLDHR
jgi:hypothetical protein